MMVRQGTKKKVYARKKSEICAHLLEQFNNVIRTISIRIY